MYSLRQYLTTLCDPHALTRTLDPLELCRDASGRPLYSVGNSAAVFRILHHGQTAALRCYFRPMRHLRAIYGERLLPQELYLYQSPTSGAWVDVVVSPWIEGITLHAALEQAVRRNDRQTLQTLSEAFDRLSAELLADGWAHGDLKPENIVVAPDQTLRLIDFDAMYLPAFTGEQSPELGTAAYQHPARTVADFDAWLDDYPIALISTALHALAIDPSLMTRQDACDGLLFTPRDLAGQPIYREVLTLFSSRGMAAAYRIAQTLCAPTPRLFGLAALFAQITRPAQTPTATPPELFVDNGRWGYRDASQIRIAPLYDEGFDFSEGLAAVRLGSSWHYLDTSGRVCICCPDAVAVKPFRDGRATVIGRHGRYEIDRTGKQI